MSEPAKPFLVRVRSNNEMYEVKGCGENQVYLATLRPESSEVSNQSTRYGTRAARRVEPILVDVQRIVSEKQRVAS